MNPRLIVVSGKSKGIVFALDKKDTSIGREPTNDICLNEPSVSRQHCLIKQEEDNCFFIQDLESFNGTFVNGTPIKRRKIEHGDQVGIGDVIMFFLLQETDSETIFYEEELAIIKDDNLTNQSTIKLAQKDAVYLRPEKLLTVLPQMARIARDLSVLLKISSVLNTNYEIESLQTNLMELIAEIIPAERGAILLTGKETEIISHFVWMADSERQKNIQISKTIIEQCLKERTSILCNDVRTDEKFQLVQSLAASDAHSILCVLLTKFEKTLGLIYLDTSDTKTVFDREHLQLLTGIAGIAASPLENARQIENLRAENQRLLNQLEGSHKIIGESEKMKDIFVLISKIAPTDSTVLILGESGTGKELVARSVHQNSNRKNNPFIAINCATLSDNLLESELFGYERGAFTGAGTTKKGQFELANGGTIFLDEIAELSPQLQAKLLRVLQEREIMRLGGIKPIKIDVRVIAATNQNIEEAIKNGAFREDLYYRLNVINIKLPPLRERRDDISLLVQFFINKYNQKCNRNIKGISPEAKFYLQKHDWTGNVRELENVIERAVILTDGNIINSEDLPEVIAKPLKKFNSSNEPLTYQDSVTKAKQIIIEDALNKVGGNINEAAKALGIYPNNLYRLMKTLGIQK
jgi:Nif-specific regulatory protein